MGTPEPARERAWLTLLLIAVNLAAFAAEVVRGGSETLLLPPGQVLIDLGANVAPFVQYAGTWEDLVTATFLHGGLAHILFNLVALYQIGPFVERTLGAARFALVYVGSAIAASLATMIASNTGVLEGGIAVGASGAICGLIGATAVLGYRLEGRKSPLARGMLRWLGITLVLGYVITLSGRIHVDNYAHVGGAVSGALWAASFRRDVQYGALGRALRLAACAGICVAACAMHVIRAREPRWDAAKVAFVVGECERLRAELRGLVPPRASVAILAQCTERVRVH